MRYCAYCGEDRVLTKEHVWPSSLIRKYTDGLKVYNTRKNNFYIGDPVIKDVCEKCNNITLSKLDSYLSSLYDQYFFKILSPGDSVEIEYDYDLLLRALLKISYNSSRAGKEDKVIKAHRKFVSFILDGRYRASIILRLQVVTSSRVLIPERNVDDILEPAELRCSYIAYNGALSHRFIVRLIAMNSYWFYIIMSYRPEAENKWRDFMAGFCSWRIQPGVLVKPNSNRLEVPVNKTTYMHSDLLGALLYANHNV